MTITVTPNITPAFSPVGSYCAGQAIAPLLTTSLNGISGNWTPALNNTITTNYTFTPSGGQCATTTNTIIGINENPTVVLAFNGAILTASAGFSAYVWTINGTNIQGANSNELIVNEVGLYTVTVTDANGCSASAEFVVQTVSLADLGLTDAISIYPNPSNGSSSLSMQLLEAQQVDLFIIDLQGKIQFSQSYTFNAGKNETLLDLTALADGVYFLQLENSNFKLTKRLIKMGN
jgi:hypothetical protein